MAMFEFQNSRSDPSRSTGGVRLTRPLVSFVYIPTATRLTPHPPTHHPSEKMRTKNSNLNLFWQNIKWCYYWETECLAWYLKKKKKRLLSGMCCAGCLVITDNHFNTPKNTVKNMRLKQNADEYQCGIVPVLFREKQHNGVYCTFHP